jgi:NADH:ubiquinone oxidoreductase subunit F (NADH-binding)
VSLSGAVERPGVYEIPLGVDLGAILHHAGAGAPSGVLIGGYFGTWLPPAAITSIRLTRADLARAGGSLGCGVIAVLPSTACPLAEVARITTWLAGQSAGQCGPCKFGLPAIAEALNTIVAGDPSGRAESALRRWLPMVDGRGACRLPDGVNRFVTSALDVFGDHLEQHRRSGTCGADTTPLLPVPRRSGGWR